MDKICNAMNQFIDDTYRNAVGEHIENITCDYKKSRAIRPFEYDLFTLTNHLNVENLQRESPANPIYNAVSRVQYRERVK